MYRLMAAGFLRHGLDFALVGYNTYAGEENVAGHVDHQVGAAMKRGLDRLRVCWLNAPFQTNETRRWTTCRRR